jgi:hypothetical protein
MHSAVDSLAAALDLLFFGLSCGQASLIGPCVMLCCFPFLTGRTQKFVLELFSKDCSQNISFLRLPLVSPMYWCFANSAQAAIKDILMSDALNAPEEDTVFEAVCAWCNHVDETSTNVDRTAHFPTLWPCIRLPLLSKSYIQVCQPVPHV